MRILVVTANFAPRGVSSGARAVHLVRYLSRLGNEIKVLTYDREMQLLFSPQDDSLSKKVPGSVQVIRIRAGLFHRWVALRKKWSSGSSDVRQSTAHNLLSSFIIPDPHIAAKSSFEKHAAMVIERWVPDALLTFSYPFTLALVGARLKRRFKRLIWIADYGDPWSGSPVRELNVPRWRKAVERWLERRALKAADVLTVTTQPTADLYARQFPELAGRTHVLTMGYDPDDVDTIPVAPRSPGTIDRVLMIHAGRLYEEARNPAPFIAALDRLEKEDPHTLDRLRIHLLGTVSPYIRSLIASSASRHIFSFAEWVPMEQCIAAMKSADYLLLFGNRGAMQIPGKIYQYIGTGRPIFLTSESDSDPVAGVLRDREGSRIIPNTEQSLFEALREIALGVVRTSRTPELQDVYAWPSIAASLSLIVETEVHKRSQEQ